MKVFLSHKMNGLSKEEVTKIRNRAKTYLKFTYAEKPIEIIDNYNHYDSPVNAGRLWHLGRSIQQMEEADAIYFCKGWWKAKGCIIERIIAHLYKLEVLK